MSRDGGLRSPLGRLRSDRTVQAVLAVVVLAAAARLVFLGGRVAHQDEARVGYWILRFLVTDRFEYRPIVHGPFLFVINRHVFGVFGPSDFTARLVVALTGSALPLSALLFRHRLKRGETVALALFLAFNPILLYYSRFMRVDLPLATFMLFTVGLWIRAYDATGRRSVGYFLAGSATFGLAFTTKENVILYPVCWAGALVLLLDHRMFRAWARDRSPVDAASEVFRSVFPTRRSIRATADRHDLAPGGVVARGAAVALVGLGIWFALVVFFYAPRGGGYPSPTGTAEGIGLWMALGSLDLGMLWAVVVDATYGTWQSFYGEWVSGGHQDHAYLPFLGAFMRTMGSGALVLSLSAVAGLLVDRYASDGPRDLVAGAGYWGVASAFGYPIVTDIAAPWTTIHAIVPLAIPAAVGAGLLYRVGLRSLAEDDRTSVGITALLAVLMIALIAVPAVSGVYLNPQSPDNEIVQYAQSSSTDVKPVLEDARQVGAENDGTDVVFYGDEWDSPDESAHDVATAGPGWFERLPLMWYFEVYEYRMATDGDPDTEFVVESTQDERVVADENPPVVVAFADVEEGSIVENERDVAPFLEGHHRWQGHRFLYDTGVQSSIVVFVDAGRLDGPAGAYDDPAGAAGRVRPIPAT